MGTRDPVSAEKPCAAEEPCMDRGSQWCCKVSAGDQKRNEGPSVLGARRVVVAAGVDENQSGIDAGGGDPATPPAQQRRAAGRDTVRLAAMVTVP